MQKVRGIKIIGTGSYLPKKVYSNEYLETLIDTNSDWIYRTLGIKERRIAEKSECTSDLAAKAAIDAIENANLEPSDIDLIIIATSTPDRLAPSTACIVQEKIKAFNAAAFDISAVCSGFLYGLTIGAQFIAANTYEKVLVIGADTFSKITDWKRRDCVFFGDGAGAAILAHNTEGKGFLASKLYADGRGKNAWTIPAGGSETPASFDTIKQNLHTFRMNGKEVFKTATEVLPQAIQEVLNEAGIEINKIKYIIPHQPSIGILKKTAEKLNIDFSKIRTNMERYANTSAATIPILLDETIKEKLIEKGDYIIFAAVGSGWTWGAILYEWN